MASIRYSLLKLFNFVKFVFYLPEDIFLKNDFFHTSVHKYIKKKHLFIVSSLCGCINKEEENANSNASEEVVHDIVLATIALKDGNYEKSGEILIKTLNLAETNNLSLGVISVCDMLSFLAIKTGDFERAEDFLIKVLDNLFKEGFPADHNFVVNFNIKLSRIYSSIGNDDLAELGYKNCLNIQKRKLENGMDEETLFLWTTTLYWFGKFLLNKNRYNEAKSCFQDCYKNFSKMDNLLPNQTMVLLYNLGDVCQKLKDFDEALKYLLKGVSFDKNCVYPDLTYFYTKLGMVSMNKGLYKEAKFWCDQGQKLAVRYHNLGAEKESKDCLKKLSNFF